MIRLTLLLLLLITAACSEGNPNDPFEGNVINDNPSEEVRLIYLDSIIMLPNCVNDSSVGEDFIKIDTDSLDSAAIDVDSLDLINKKFSDFEFTKLYNIVPLYVNKMYDYITETQKMLYVLDDGTLIENTSDTTADSIIITNTVSADESVKTLNITKSDLSLVITAAESKTSAGYSLGLATKNGTTSSTIAVTRTGALYTTDMTVTDTLGESHIYIERDYVDTNIDYRFSLKMPTAAVAHDLLVADTITAEGIIDIYKRAILKVHINGIPLRDAIREKTVQRLKEVMGVEAYTRAAYFYSTDSARSVAGITITDSLIVTPIDSLRADTALIAAAAPAERIPETTLQGLFTYYDLNNRALLDNDHSFLENYLHVYYMTDSIYYMQRNGTMTYFCDETPTIFEILEEHINEL